LFVEERRRLKIISVVAVDGVNLKPSPGDIQSDSRGAWSVATSPKSPVAPRALMRQSQPAAPARPG